MGIVHEPARPHTCEPPAATNLATIWKCDDCGQLWRYERPWARVTELSKDSYVSMPTLTILLFAGSILAIAVVLTILVSFVGD